MNVLCTRKSTDFWFNQMENSRECVCLCSLVHDKYNRNITSYETGCVYMKSYDRNAASVRFALYWENRWKSLKNRYQTNWNLIVLWWFQRNIPCYVFGGLKTALKLLRFTSVKRNFSFYFHTQTNPICITYQIFPLDLFMAKTQLILYSRSTASFQWNFCHFESQ